MTASQTFCSYQWYFLIPKRKFVFNFFQQYPEDPAEFKPLTEDEYVFITFADYTVKASKYIIS